MRDRRDPMEELIWESRDGEISAADRTRLELHLAQHPEARTVAQSADLLATRLEAAGRPVPTPPELRPRIFAALAAARRDPRRGGLLETIRSLLTPPPVLRPAYLAAGLLGLVLGAGGFYLVESIGRLGPIPEHELYGTMRARTGGGIDVALAGGAGTLTLRRDGALLEIEAGLAGGVPESADEIQLRGEGLRTRGFEPQAGGTPRLEASAQAVVLSRLDSGRHRLIVELSDPGAPVELLVFGRGRPILRREIRLADL
jgi:hypothetical protein